MQPSHEENDFVEVTRSDWEGQRQENGKRTQRQNWPKTFEFKNFFRMNGRG